ncbi:hypothetical protein [Streptomyces tropicalis]|uniref:Uncharacterized protein n=1 Tax=Streptomyces tropicalis TaxID=3034234 RepID=A0ABT6A277_9ACTN|nr:hypothetical protein [Streptomyces tropicalis]MDF3298753.1 hypothetical protein [Streptomyces tropicalis]
MQPSAIRDRVYYRCEYEEQEAALYPGLDHPRTINLREDIICRARDAWIARACTPERLTATITALSQAGIAANAAQPQTPEQAQARPAIKECERRLARYQAALGSGADPAVVTQWINDAQLTDSETSHNVSKPPTPRRESPFTTSWASRSCTTTQRGPRPLGRGPRFRIAIRSKECPRGESTADDTVVVARGILYL